MAFDKRDPAVPTERWLGQIYELEPDGGFNGLVGKIVDEEAYEFERDTFIRVPLKNIIEAERLRISRAAHFFCDVELDGEQLKNIRGIEFIEPERIDPEEMHREAEQFFAENPGILDD